MAEVDSRPVQPQASLRRRRASGVWPDVSWRHGVIGASIVIITAAHFATPAHVFVLHNVLQRLYYVPIFIAAYWYGLSGAMSASALSAASYLPYISLVWGSMGGEHDEYLQAQYAELVMFQVVAFIAGQLARSEHRLREVQRRTARELGEAYQELRESFELLERADRMSSLGELSAGVAHEIKNPLASIKGSLDIVSADYPPEHPKREFVEIMDREIRQLSRIVTEFLDFARTPRPAVSSCNLRDVVESLKVLCAQEASHHRVEISISEEGPLEEIAIDASQVQQALLNVVLNAIQAMSGGGRLQIVLGRSENGVRIEIRDEGPGIPEEARARIFDPFFTTKARGTGLGLAIAAKLIRAQGGDIRLLHEHQGPGAAFLIELPRGRESS